MSVQSFSLSPFDSAFEPATLNFSGSVERIDHRLVLQYNLFDDLSEVLIPAAKSPNRQHDLWKTTCFEFFLSGQDDRQYWEFNLSPSGDWNAYRFDHYRAGMQEETAFSSLPFEIETRSHQTSLTIKLDLTLIQIAQSIDLGITAVIEQFDHQITYWALKHCGKEADFHIRESFALKL
ncbi:MAG: DOMON-like domain-containing protein [Plectolyngbya sp. WJT66-NPBG17]|jgi:hypothetical protein|nr:DOMON-like domain-containing protein [Plectolyngbya sp. WJT66-NPBG17]